MSDWVLTAVSGSVATLTLNRPQTRNALSPEMRRALLEALTMLKADATVRSVVITGSGGAFCSGLDLKALSLRSAQNQLLKIRQIHAPFMTFSATIVSRSL